MSNTKSRRGRESLAEALLRFSHLPDEAYARLVVVAALLSCSPATVWRRSGDPKSGMPKPVKLGPRITGWPVGPLKRYLLSLATSEAVTAATQEGAQDA